MGAVIPIKNLPLLSETKTGEGSTLSLLKVKNLKD